MYFFRKTDERKSYYYAMGVTFRVKMLSSIKGEEQNGLKKK